MAILSSHKMADADQNDQYWIKYKKIQMCIVFIIKVLENYAMFLSF